MTREWTQALDFAFCLFLSFLTSSKSMKPAILINAVINLALKQWIIFLIGSRNVIGISYASFVHSYVENEQTALFNEI